MPLELNCTPELGHLRSTVRRFVRDRLEPIALAIDATGLRLLDDFRKEAKLDPLAKKTTWLDSAEFLGLGAAAENRIDLVRTGLQSEVRMGRP